MSREGLGGLAELGGLVAGAFGESRARLGYEGSPTTTGDDQALLIELPVGTGHGVGGKFEVGCELAHRRQSGPLSQDAGDDEVVDLVPNLAVGRAAVVEVD